jgi:uncharacterized phiE125 gp8 family phage protein
MGYQLITPPSGEPIDLPTAKTHLRVETGMTDDDALIGLLITAARMYAEQLTARSFITQVWKYTLDSFPGPALENYVPWGVEYTQPPNAVMLEKGPIVSIDSITYVDMAGATQTMPSSDYVADLSGTLVRVTPKFGKIWPITLPQIGSAAVNFTAGYGVASAVPQGIKQWLLLRIGALYESREEVVSGRSVSVTPMPFVDSLLDPYRIVRA